MPYSLKSEHCVRFCFLFLLFSPAIFSMPCRCYAQFRIEKWAHGRWTMCAQFLAARKIIFHFSPATQYYSNGNISIIHNVIVEHMKLSTQWRRHRHRYRYHCHRCRMVSVCTYELFNGIIWNYVSVNLMSHKIANWMISQLYKQLLKSARSLDSKQQTNT